MISREDISRVKGQGTIYEHIQGTRVNYTYSRDIYRNKNGDCFGEKGRVLRLSM